MRRILIVDGDSEFAYGVQVELRCVPYDVALVPTADAALEVLDRATPDMMIVDLHLPDRPGLELLRELRAAGHRLPVLVLTADMEPEKEVAAFDAGADDFVVKGRKGMAEIVARIGVRVEGAPMARRVDPRLTVEPDRRRVTTRQGSLDLPEREWELFVALHKAGGRFITIAELKREVWRVGASTGSGAVWACVSSLRAKLARIGLTGGIIRRRGLGYAWDFDGRPKQDATI